MVIKPYQLQGDGAQNFSEPAYCLVPVGTAGIFHSLRQFLKFTVEIVTLKEVLLMKSLTMIDKSQKNDNIKKQLRTDTYFQE